MIFKMLFILSFSTLALAHGNEVGNGGDAVVCRLPNTEIVSAELLDFYENREFSLRKFRLDLGAANLSVEAKVQLALNRFGTLSPWRKKTFEKRMQEFESKALRKHKIQLVDVSDSAHIGMRAGCQVEQLVLMNMDADEVMEYKYTINQDIWEHLPADHQAGAILHEIVFEEFLRAGHQNSRQARVMTSFLASTELKTFTLEQYFSFLIKLKLWVTDYDNRLYDLTYKFTEFYTGFSLKRGQLIDGTPFSFLVGVNSVTVGGADDNGHSYHSRPCTELNTSPNTVEFWPSGKLKMAVLFQPQELTVGSTTLRFRQSGQASHYGDCGLNTSGTDFNPVVNGNTPSIGFAVPVYFNETGHLLAGILDPARVDIYVGVNGMKPFSSARLSHFYANGRLRLSYSDCAQINLSDDTLNPPEYGCYFKFADGSSRFVPVDSQLEFNQDGEVLPP